ncbi:AMM_1a_G0022520.mRNA.1.CDS.1 [Saccharomyces cerevisiae]|nr:AMM_1a_G0022520.mRNA.1.CDS.1 [Saccharomyces cerevisiae]CAI6694779.1 AMM_1a_G0022520.mRNA.1.CDS.1 [Saccharomyces cerevisiae]
MTLVKQVNFGGAGLKVSPVVVGCMTYGSKAWSPWVLDDKEQIFKILKHCYDQGLRTFDTADVYSNGKSERLLGEFLKHYKINRETVVILSKVRFGVDESLELPLSTLYGTDEQTALTLANQGGLSRKHILDGVVKSVERLGTYIDVLQIHRADPDTPMEETMKALNDVIERGDVRYIGASTMKATEFVEMQYIAEKHNWFKFVSWQSMYNLLYREDEREVIPFAKKHNIALIPWSPNARGLLTRPWGREKTERSIADKRLQEIPDNDKEIIRRVQKVAEDKGLSMAQVASAWVMSKGCYPIVGLSSVERVDEIIKAIDVNLTDDEITYLEELYKPKPQH